MPKRILWTKERCAQEAKKYKNFQDFSRNSRNVYYKCKSRGWLEEVCFHMELPEEITKSICIKEARKYRTRTEFRDHNNRLYRASIKNGWIEEVCSHMKPKWKPAGYWTKERSFEEAINYSSRSEFRKNSNRAYEVLRANGLLDKACQHMYKPEPHNYERYSYAIEFPRVKKVYVGITYNLKRRRNKHFRKSDGISHHKNKHLRNLINSGEPYNWNENKEPFHMEKAKEMEQELYDVYLNDGWELLNIAKVGSLGAKASKTKKECHIDALKYKTRNEFIKGNPGSYSTASKYGWLDDICKHMIELSKPSGYWTKERCAQEAKKYKTKSEFSSGSSVAYSKSLNEGWLDDITKHMTSLKKPSGYWTKERCAQEAKKYKTKSEFRKKSASAYALSLKRGWLDDICKHMIELSKPSGYWTKERCVQEAKKYSKMTPFMKNSRGAYASARKNGWLDEVTGHMVRTKKKHGYWTKERCAQEAKKYSSRKEFKEFSGSAYSKSVKNKWLDDICSHMES